MKPRFLIPAVYASLGLLALRYPLTILPARVQLWQAVMLILAWWFFRNAGVSLLPSGRGWRIAAAAGSLSLLLLPGTILRLPVLLLTAGALLGWFSRAEKEGETLYLLGAVQLLLTVLLKPFILLQAYLQSRPATGWGAALLGRWLTGSDCGYLAGRFHLRYAYEVFEFSTAPEWTGYFFRLGLGITFLILVFRYQRRNRALLFIRFYLFFLLWGAAVFLAQSLLAVYLNFHEIPWSPLFQWVAYVPLALVAYRLLENPVAAASKETSTGNRVSPSLVIWGAVSVFLVTWGMIHTPGGTTKAGRILIDEGHSNWEWSTVPMDTAHFGSRTTYNYYGMFRLLSQYYDVEIGRSPLTPQLLSKVDILFIKTPTEPFDSLETAAVTQFVKAGGGLFVVSDHTDIFGMSTFSNALVEKFGFRFNKDAVFNLLNTNDQLWVRNTPLPHPVIGHLPYYHYLTGCSLQPLTPFLSAPLVGTQVGSDLVNYTAANFFDRQVPRSEIRFGPMLQMAAVTYGRGRIVGFTDSTTYSNFAVFWPGRLEQLLGVLEWLNRRNGFPYNLTALGAGLLLILFLLVKGVLNLRYLLLGALLGAPPALLWSLHLRTTAYPLPPNRRPLPCAVLDTTLSNVHLPLYNELPADDPRDLETAFIWLFRTGLLPRLTNGPILSEEKLRLIVNPRHEWPDSVAAACRDFLEKGGEVLVLASPGNFDPSINNFLAPYGIFLHPDHLERVRLRAPHRRTLPIYVPTACSVSGGQPLHVLENGLPVSVVTQAGRGKLVVSGLGQCFTTSNLGRYDSVPAGLAWEYLQLYYRLLFQAPCFSPDSTAISAPR